MFASARKALGVFFDPAFRWVLWKSLGLTLGLFGLLFFAVEYALTYLPAFNWHWLNTAADILGPFLVLAALVLLGPVVAAMFASMFLDDIAEAVEKRAYPGDPPSKGIPFWRGLGSGMRLTVLVIGTTVVLLPFDVWTPGFGEAATWAINGWLLGREFFELAALRHLAPADARRLRRRHGVAVWSAGMLLALLAVIPVVDFFAPLFGAAMMVHLYKRYAHREQLRERPA